MSTRPGELGLGVVGLGSCSNPPYVEGRVRIARCSGACRSSRTHIGLYPRLRVLTTDVSEG